MTEKLIYDMNIVSSKVPLPTLEVDLDSIPEKYLGYSGIVTNSLRIFAEKNPKVRASIYVYQGMSINFHEETFSALFAIDSKQNIKLLNHILLDFKKIKNIKTKPSDYIMSSDGLLEFHIEEGIVWRQSDIETWYSVDKYEEFDADKNLEKFENNSYSTTNKIFEGKTTWILPNSRYDIEKAIIRNNKTEIVIDLTCEDILYTVTLRKDTDENKYTGTFIGRKGGDTFNGIASCSLFEYNDDILLFGSWIENNITFHWWTELYEID